MILGVVAHIHLHQTEVTGAVAEVFRWIIVEVKKGQDIYAGLFITLHFTTGRILKFSNDVVHNNFISRGIQRGIGNAIILLYIIFQVRKNVFICQLIVIKKSRKHLSF